MNGDALQRWEAVELKVLSPENVICFGFAGGAGKESIIEAQLTEVFLLGSQVLCLDDPEAEYIFSTTAVVLCRRKSSALIQNPSKLNSVSSKAAAKGCLRHPRQGQNQNSESDSLVLRESESLEKSDIS